MKNKNTISRIALVVMVSGISTILNSCLAPLSPAQENGNGVVNTQAALAPDDVANKSIIFESVSTWRDEALSCDRPVLQTEGFAQYWDSRSQQITWTRVNNVFSPSTLFNERPLIWKPGNTVNVTESCGSGDDYMENRFQMVYKRTGPNTAFVEYNHHHERMTRFYHHCNYYELTFETPTSGTFRAVVRELDHYGYEDIEKGRFRLK